MAAESRFCPVELFDRLGRLRPFDELAPEIQQHIKAFEVRRRWTRCDGETVITEELIRVVLRDGRVAKLAERGGTRLSLKGIASQPIGRRLVTTIERKVGAGRTEAAVTIDVEKQR